MKLSHLRDVLAVADHGGIRAAGRKLGLTQPTITRSIREIEQELGVSLFERSSNGVRLTDAGRVFVRRAEAVQREMLRAREEIEQLRGATIGEVSVALSTATIMSMMARGMAGFRRKYPDALVRIHESFFQPIEDDLLNGRIDFYVGPLDRITSAPQLLVEPLFDNHRLIVGRKGHPLAHARSLEQLTGARWVRPTMSTHIVEGDFEEMFARAGMRRPTIVLQAPSALAHMLAVAGSDLLTFVPRQWVELPMLAGMIEPLALQPFPAAPIAIVRRKDMPLTPVAEYFCDMMRRVGVQHAHAYGLAAAPS